MTSPAADPVRHAYAEAVAAYLELLGTVHDDDWSRAALGVWNVRDLVGHTTRALLTVESYLDPGRVLDDPALVDAPAYFLASAAGLADADAVAERGRAAGAALGDDPVASVARTAERVLDLVEGCRDDAPVRTPVGSMTLSAYLPTRIVELVVHGLDLADALGAERPRRYAEPLGVALQVVAGLAASRDDAADVLLALAGRGPLPAAYTVF